MTNHPMTTERQWIRTDADTLKLSGTRVVISHMDGAFVVLCSGRMETWKTVQDAKIAGEKFAEDFGELALEWKE